MTKLNEIWPQQYLILILFSKGGWIALYISTDELSKIDFKRN